MDRVWTRCGRSFQRDLCRDPAGLSILILIICKSNFRKLWRVLATMESTLTWTCIKYQIPESILVKSQSLQSNLQCNRFHCDHRMFWLGWTVTGASPRGCTPRWTLQVTRTPGRQHMYYNYFDDYIPRTVPLGGNIYIIIVTHTRLMIIFYVS